MTEMFYAVRGQGSFLNGKKLDVRNINDLGHYVASFSHKSKSEFSFLAQNADLLRKKNYRFHVFGSFTLCACYVACGRMDALLSHAGDICIWDIAAALLILREAHGLALNENNENYQFWDQYFFAMGKPKHQFLIKKLLPYYSNE